MMRLLRMPLLGWQQHVADVTQERDENGLYCYDTVIIRVGRRGGKTRLAHGRNVARAHAGPVRLPTGRVLPYRAAYSAQNIEAAIRRLTETWDGYSESMAPALVSRSRLLRGKSSAAIEFNFRHPHRRGALNPAMARLAVFAATRHNVRGDVYIDTTIDEALKFSREAGQDLLEAIGPTLTETHGQSQLWIISNEGKDPGGWLPQLVARGVAAVKADRRAGVAFFDWSADDDADPADPAVWAAVHPAYGEILTEAAMRADLERMGVDAFAREYLNMHGETAELRRIDPAAWAALGVDELAPPPRGRLVLGVDIALDRSDAAIVAAYRAEDGRPALQLLEHRPGGAWVTALTLELAREHRAHVAYDLYGPALDVGAELGRHRVHLHPYDSTRNAAACAGLQSRVENAALLHKRATPLDAALEAAATRRVGDRWIWDRQRSPLSISPLIAATIALDALLGVSR